MGFLTIQEPNMSNSKAILTLLSNRHSEDVFVPECKDGPTMGCNHFRLDAWVMKKSWTNPMTFGYEIKVSRSDFINDNKWHNYLPLCNQFYFVCPFGLIQPDELPAEAGVIWASKNFTRLYIKKKAPARMVDIPISLYQYILMCRTEITRDINYFGKSDAEYWRDYMALKKENIDFGHRVGKKIKEVIKKEIEEVKSESKKIHNQNEEFKKIKDFLIEIGVDVERKFGIVWSAKKKIKEIDDIIPDDVERVLKNASICLLEVNDKIKKLKSSGEEDII